MIMKISDWLHKVETSQSLTELANYYTAWAYEYDNEPVMRGRRNPSLVSAFAARYVPTHEHILDAGVGTGVLGELLHLLGYTDITGIDMVQAMLDVTDAKQIYHALHHMTLGEKLTFEDNTFGAVISAGVFVPNHAPPHSFDELIRITRPFGHIIFSINYQAYLHEGFHDKFKALEQIGLWQLLHEVPPYPSGIQGEPDRLAQVYVYQVCQKGEERDA